MNFIIAYFKGIWQVLRSIKIIGIHYLVLLILGLLSTLPFFSLMDSKIGHSLAIEKLLPTFDYTVYQDFRNLPGVKDTLSAIMNMNLWLLLLFALLSVFLTGGILQVYKNAPEKFTLRSFFSGCTYYFWRLFRLSIYFLGVHFAVAALFVFIFGQLTEGGFDRMGSEVGYINLLQTLIPIYLLVAALFFMVQDYAKIHLVHRDKGILFRSIWEAFPLAFGHFFNTFLLYLLNAATFLGIAGLYYYATQSMSSESPRDLLLLLLVGQLFVLCRIGLRLLNLSSATLVYKGIMAKRERKSSAAQQAEAARLQAIADAEAEAEAARLQAERANAAALIATEKAHIAEQKAAAIDTSTQNIPETPISPTNSNKPIFLTPPIREDLFEEEE